MNEVQSILSVVSAVTALVVALTGLFVSIGKITQLRDHLNSRLDQLLSLQAASSYAMGIKDEKQRNEETH